VKAEVSRLQRSVSNRLYEFRNDPWGATLEDIDPEDQTLEKFD
jgi:hypothetical protein